jgi:hypothetical protein
MKSLHQGSWWVGVGSICVLFMLAGSSRAADIDLTGTWYDKESVTYIRQVGTDVWWMCRTLKDGGKDYTNVFKGKLTGTKATGEWADVPAGKNKNHGTITFNVVVKDGKPMAIEVDIKLSGEKKSDRYRLTKTKPK